MNQSTLTLVFKNITAPLPLGLFLLDKTRRIHEWNSWMEEKTTISSEAAIGNTLSTLFPGFEHPRFEWALQMVFSCAAPQLLSQVLNHYVIPIPVHFKNTFGFTKMQQKVQVSPFYINKERFALITILDVTEAAIQERALVQAAFQLQENSHRDPLTDLYNRRFMYTWLNNALILAKRFQHPIACLLFDLDHFKQINDDHGHQAGDQVLIEFSKLISQEVRESDIFVRYGGEEFVIILQDCTLANAIKRAKLLGALVREATIGGLEPGKVTCSIGAASCGPKNRCQPDDLLLKADKQLYEAKRTGRDRVC